MSPRPFTYTGVLPFTATSVVSGVPDIIMKFGPKFVSPSLFFHV